LKKLLFPGEYGGERASCMDEAEELNMMVVGVLSELDGLWRGR